MSAHDVINLIVIIFVAVASWYYGRLVGYDAAKEEMMIRVFKTTAAVADALEKAGVTEDQFGKINQSLDQITSDHAKQD